MTGGYFSPAAPALDPALFDGDRLRPDAGHHIVTTLGTWFSAQGYQVSRKDIHIWLAGSGISYHWGNGDLDAFFALDIARFTAANSWWDSFGARDIADGLNAELRETLWPQDASVALGGSVYGITYYCLHGPQLGAGLIKQIHPYAAYSVTDDIWVVPPGTADGLGAAFPQSWHQAAASDSVAAQALSDAHMAATALLSQVQPGSAAYQTATAQLHLAAARATALYDDIHHGRAAAFGPQGHGYSDYVNFRWQSAKRSGAADILRGIASAGDAARRAEETQLYGQPLDAAEVVLRRAAHANRTRRPQ